MNVKLMPQKITQPLGFTLAETLIAIGIFLMASSLVLTFMKQSFEANRFALEQSDAISYARKNIDTMVKEIRKASPAENGSYPIESAQNQSLAFYSDINNDGVFEKVRYFLDNTELKKGVIVPTGFPAQYTATETITTVSKYVQNSSTPIFYYYNSNYPTDTTNNPLPTPAAVNQIRLIRLFLKINIDIDKAPDSYILISNAQIRNLKDNL
ncbi:MAG: type II secretion system protein [Patescibacteria group bacterium]